MGFPEKAYIQGVDGQKKKVEFLFNPSQYNVSRSISYRRAESKGSDVPPLEFVTGEGRTLTFELISLSDGDVIVRDRETGSTWSGLSGEALEGPLAGSTLQKMPAFYAFWFAWKDFFIEAELYEMPASS